MLISQSWLRQLRICGDSVCGATCTDSSTSPSMWRCTHVDSVFSSELLVRAPDQDNDNRFLCLLALSSVAEGKHSAGFRSSSGTLLILSHTMWPHVSLLFGATCSRSRTAASWTCRVCKNWNQHNLHYRQSYCSFLILVQHIFLVCEMLLMLC